MNEVDVLCVTVRKHDGVLGVAIDEKYLEFGAALGVEEEVIWVHGEPRYGRLEK